MRPPVVLPLLFILAAATPARPAPQPPRPLSGCGVLCVTGSAPEGESLTVYAEPGVKRVALLPLSRVPQLSRGKESALFAALGRKGKWLKIAYDDAERQGWIEAPRRWEFLPWREALSGRSARILPAMKKGSYGVRETPSEGGATLAELSRDQTVRIISVKEDWARLEAPAGWFRWRDAEGRLTISLSAGAVPEKR